MKHLFLCASMMFAVACGGGKPKTDPTPPVTPPSEVGSAAEKPAVPEPVAEKKEEPPPAPKTATAKLAPTTKTRSKVTGTITFKEVDGGVEATATLEGLTPGDHAWHVHEKGDCSAPDGTSAGGHFNPENHQHGAPDAEQHHAGDFGNLTAGKDGKATKTFTMKGITLGEGATSIAGKGFIVHAKQDDFKTQPTGGAGDRVACGVIELDAK